MIEFGGWEMPVQYSSLVEEHRAVRERAGLFDVSHMGECRLTGPESASVVNRLITNDSSSMAVGQILYSPMCNEKGGTVDDLIVYRFGPEDFLLIINASNREKDLAWITKHTAGFDVTVCDESDRWGQLALQGPRSPFILEALGVLNPAELAFFTFRPARISGQEVIISRSGYTGEDGFEIYCSAEALCDLWTEILGAGSSEGLLPCGLGARDTLRFEAALPLYGNELDEDISPLEAGLATFVKLDGEDFIGREALGEQKKAGLTRKLVGLEMIGKGIPRHGYSLFDSEGREIGRVTTGYAAPTVGKRLALALVEAAYTEPGTKISVVIRNKQAEAEVCGKRFYRKKYKR